MYVLFPMIKPHEIRVIKYIAIILWLYNMRTVSRDESQIVVSAIV